MITHQPIRAKDLTEQHADCILCELAATASQSGCSRDWQSCRNSNCQVFGICVLTPLCGRCGGLSPGGGWCAQCVQESLSYTEWRDVSRLPELNTEPLDWAAILYARAKIPVFPLRPGTKVPATANGFKDATTDLRVVRSWWRDNPRYNIGLATGHKFDVLDVDIKGGRPGEESAERLRVAGLIVGPWEPPTHHPAAATSSLCRQGTVSTATRLLVWTFAGWRLHRCGTLEHRRSSEAKRRNRPVRRRLSVGVG
jgi:hypothetical protein